MTPTPMNKLMRKGTILTLALSGAACGDYLQGPGLTEDPNNPVAASAAQQLIAFQASISTRLEGQTARNAGVYTQQIMGTNNQQLTYATQYGITEADVGGQMTGYYTGAGLVALRNIQAYGAANSDPTLLGIAKIWEGFSFGMATSVFGDLPYTEANDPSILTPRLDAQQAIYADVQTRLDEGITALLSAPTTGNCDPADLIYCATTVTRAVQISRWIAAARTMKARFYLHLVERNGNAAYTLARTQALLGIAEAPTTAAQAYHGQAPGDFRTFHGSTLDVDGNIWAEFLTARGGDIGAASNMVSLLTSRGDPRLSQYFTVNGAGVAFGVNQNNVLVGAGPASSINLTVRRVLTFRQPIVTWAENQLILAEANFQLTGAASALPFVNAVRAALGMSALGSVTYQDVMLEKYVAMFQNIEVWNDYKRSCVPTLARYGTATEIPGRLPYASAERSANPNIPTPTAYPAGTTGSSALRNWNDVAACP